MLDQLPALDALLAVVLMAATSAVVGFARGKYGVKAPATSGHPVFERAFRVQMNTLESAVMFLPLLWLATHYGMGRWAGIAGLVWVLGRVWYVAGYLKEASKREAGYTLGTVALLALLGMAALGIGRALFAA